MNVILQISGKTPLLMHNARGANPDDPIVRDKAAITSKRKKTPEDRAMVAYLEWMHSVYEDNGVVVVPTANVVRCFANAGKTRKLGTAIERGLSPLDLNVTLDYDGGPQPLETLARNPRFVSTMSVGQQRQRIMRTRPVFPEWSLTVEMLLMEEMVDLRDLSEIASLAGRIEGLGDGRRWGYGRFTAIAKEA
jgi:hypothetical protein